MPAPYYRLTTNLVPSSARGAQNPLRYRREDLGRLAERRRHAERGLRVALPELRHHRRQLAFQMRPLREKQRHYDHGSLVGEPLGRLVKGGRHEFEERELDRRPRRAQPVADALERLRPFGLARAVGEEDDSTWRHGKPSLAAGGSAVKAVTRAGPAAAASQAPRRESPGCSSRARTRARRR